MEAKIDALLAQAEEDQQAVHAAQAEKAKPKVIGSEEEREQPNGQT